MQNRLAVGVDIGGTKVAFVLIDEQGSVLAQHQLLTGAEDGPEAVIDRIAQGIQVVMRQRAGQPIAGIGIGSPGYIDSNTGTVHAAVNLGWVDVPLCAALRQRLAFDIPIWLQKDANAALLGEIYFGAARGFKDVILVAVGTGLGVGAVVGGQIIIGANHYATDVGHLALNPAGRLCGCGLRGCTEMYVSGVGLLAAVREHRADYPQSPLAHMDFPSTTAILQAARDGDALAHIVMDEAAEWLGMVFAYCGVMLNPALFVLGGGLGLAAADLLLERAEREFRRRVLPPIMQNVRIVRSQVTVSAIGAACLVWNGLQ
jgi:glucokinase